jgi:hypothetical protein
MIILSKISTNSLTKIPKYFPIFAHPERIQQTLDSHHFRHNRRLVTDYFPGQSLEWPHFSVNKLAEEKVGLRAWRPPSMIGRADRIYENGICQLREGKVERRLDKFWKGNWAKELTEIWDKFWPAFGDETN